MKYLRSPYVLSLALVVATGTALFLSAGPTWQIYPACLAMLLTIPAWFLGKAKWSRALASMTLLNLTALSLGSLYLFPVMTLPEPTGEYQVGVRYELVETDREETMTPVPGDTRELYLKIWYPAEKGTSAARYLEGGEATIDVLLSRVSLPIPGFLFHHIARARTNGYLDAPFAEGVFPFITFSHGHGTMWQSQSTSLMEELASQGIVVASIAHSHQTQFAAASENSIVTFERIVPLVKGEIDPALADAAERRRSAASTKSEMDSFVRDNVAGDEAANEFVAIWSADIRSVVDALVDDSTDPESFFYQRLDTSKIGSAGMSFGGAAAVESTLSDPRLRAALNMDGMQFGNLINETTGASLLFLEAKKFDHNLSKYGAFFDRSTEQVSCLMFEGAKHSNFSDLSLVSPLLVRLGLLGEIDGRFFVEQVNRIASDFFHTAFSDEPFQVDRYLIPGKIELPES